jgi:hypothetical protein
MSRPKRKGVREPIQVYLTEHDRELLDRVAKTSGLSRAEILRRGLRRVGADVLGESHPVLALLDEMAAANWPAKMPTDIAQRHDHYLADEYAETHKRRKR